MVKDSYPNSECPDCGDPIPESVQPGDDCENCGHVFWEELNIEEESINGKSRR